MVKTACAVPAVFYGSDTRRKNEPALVLNMPDGLPKGVLAHYNTCGNITFGGSCLGLASKAIT